MQCPIEANQTKLHTIRSDMLNNLWNPVSIFQERSIGDTDSKLEKTVTLSKVKVKLSFQKQMCIHKINLFRVVKSMQSIQTKTNTMKDFMRGFL